METFEQWTTRRHRRGVEKRAVVAHLVGIRKAFHAAYIQKRKIGKASNHATPRKCSLHRMRSNGGEHSAPKSNCAAEGLKFRLSFEINAECATKCDRHAHEAPDEDWRGAHLRPKKTENIGRSESNHEEGALKDEERREITEQEVHANAYSHHGNAKRLDGADWESLAIGEVPSNVIGANCGEHSKKLVCSAHHGSHCRD